MPRTSQEAEQPGRFPSEVKLLTGILDQTDQLVQMSYLDDMTMVYANATAKAFRGGGDEDHHGRHCYEYMMGLSEQCPFCPLLQGDGPNACGEVDNGKQVFAVKTATVEWNGRPAFVEYAADITPSRRAQQSFESQVRTLLRSIPEAQGIMHFDLTDDRCITVNGAATNNLKSVQSQVPVNTTLAQIFAYVPDEAKRAEAFAQFNRDTLMQAFENGTVEQSRDVQSYFDDGSIRWARITARVMQNPANGHLECVLYGLDISEEVNQRKALEQRALHHLALFNSLAKDYLNVFLIHPETDSVNILKLDGFVTSGLTAEGNGTYPYEATYARYIEERVHPEDKQRLFDAMRLEVVQAQLAKTPEYIGTYRVLDKGETHYYQFKYLAAENDEGILVGFQNVDATIAEEREQQEILKTALNAAEEASADKSIFLSNMSHDIRTPLNAILGFNELAKTHVNSPDEVLRYLNKVTIAGNHLLDLINDVLDMSHIESGRVKLDKAPFSLQSLFDELRTIIAGNAEAGGIQLTFDTSKVRHLNVVGDELKIKKVLMNILGNAVKFTKPGGKVTFRVEERALRSSRYAHYVFRISDTGIGMTEEFVAHAFEAFAREKQDADGSVVGTGLGLSIAKNLVNIMNGSIGLKSKKGVGTEFVVTLHLETVGDDAGAAGANAAQGKGAGSWHAGLAVDAAANPAGATDPDAEAAADPARARRAQSMAGKRILLVEDNEFNREIAYEILSNAGFKVETANDGSVAVDMVANSPAGTYDLVLMDIQMPTMNGYEATRAIRELPDPKRAHLPIIAVTANAFSSDRDAALAAGMDGHIAKPIDVDMLIGKMVDLLDA